MRDAEGCNAREKAALEVHSVSISVIKMDVADDESVAAGLARILNDGPVDVLINNAGNILNSAVGMAAKQEAQTQGDVCGGAPMQASPQR